MREDSKAKLKIEREKIQNQKRDASQPMGKQDAREWVKS